MLTDDIDPDKRDVADAARRLLVGRGERVLANDENSADDQRTDRNDRDRHQQAARCRRVISTEVAHAHQPATAGAARIVGHDDRTGGRHCE